MAHILLVDDNRVNQKLAASILEKFGYTVDISASGEEALRLCAAEKAYALILMDIRMPGIDGIETARIIRSGTVPKIRRNIPIIAMTAGDLEEDQEACMAVGMNGFITKPIQPLELKKTVEQVLAGCPNVVPIPFEPISVPPQAEGDVVWNFEKTLTRLGGDVSLAKRLLAIFLVEMPKNFATIKNGLVNHDADMVEVAAHSIKGACRNLEIQAMTTVALAVEDAARNKNLPHAAALFPAVESEFERFKEVVTSMEILDEEK